MDKATMFVRGRVQGVGFRWWTRSQALRLGLVGYVANLSDGRVEVCAQGGRDRIEELATLLEEMPSTCGRPGRVQNVVLQWGTPRPELEGFVER